MTDQKLDEEVLRVIEQIDNAFPTASPEQIARLVHPTPAQHAAWTKFWDVAVPDDTKTNPSK